MTFAGPVVSTFIEAILARLKRVETIHFLSTGLESELYELEHTLHLIHCLLNDATHKEATNKSIALWLGSLQHLCYDLDDVIDEVATKAMDRELTKEPESESITSKVRQKLDSFANKLHSTEKQKLDSITKRLQHLQKRQYELGLEFEKPKTSSLEFDVIGPALETRRYDLGLTMIDENAKYSLEYDVIGRERDRETLVNKLLQHDAYGERFSIVQIVGLGGVGKTTLARDLYDDMKVNGQFELKAWVCVAGDFDVFENSKTIFQSMTNNVDKEFEDLNQLQMALVEQVKFKRFLLVLDDVWNENYITLEELVRPFKIWARRCKIVMTTRKVQWHYKIDHIYHLECLSHEDALSLLAIHALGADNFDSHPSLRPQGEGIVKKCGCLPLALKAFGKLLNTKTNGKDWDVVLNTKIWDLPIADEIFQPLMLSYHDLSTDLKWLFGYCSLFPKGFLFDREELVLLWLAEGYLNKSIVNESQESAGHAFFETLLLSSFFQHAPNKENLFGIHDLMNDLATFVAGDCFLRFDNQMRMQNKALTKYRHMSFIQEKYAGYRKFEELERTRFLRTMLAVSVGVDKSWNFLSLPNKILNDVLLRLPLLRVLYLSNCNICEVPDSVGGLKYLRYVNFSQTKIKELPENVGNLYHLQILIVFGCRSLTKLPKSFLKLKKLRHFDIRETPLLKLPLGIGELKSLKSLPKIIIEGDNGFAITKLKGLKNPHGELFIEGVDKVQSPIHAREAELVIKRLTKLDLKWGNVFNTSQSGTLQKEVLNELKPCNLTLNELAFVSYGGMEFPMWVGDPSFSLLVDVSIIDCRNCTSLPPLGNLFSLKKLFIKGMDEIKVIGSKVSESIIAFPNLEILVFENMVGWEVWSTNSETLLVDFPCLRELQIKNCPNLVDVSLKAMPSLRVLQIGECGYGVLRSLVQIASSITELEIRSISGLTYEVWRGFIGYLWAIEELSIKECNEMRCLWESQVEAGMALVNLRKLEVFGCSNLVSLGEKEEDNCERNLLTSLRNLEVWFCGRMKRCSCPYGIESLTIGSCSSLTHVSFPMGGPKLKSLSLYGCHKLKEKINNTSMPMLEIVNIRRWSNLKSIVELGNFTNLTCLMIQDCQSLESFPDLLLPQLSHLTIGDCQRLELFPDLHLSNCTLLKHLEITNCASIDVSFPYGIWPPRLCSLEIGGLKKPIFDWGPQNFPSSLVCLKLLGENVSSSNQFSYLLPPSLTELHIQEFDELESLSTGLQHLTSLHHLSIYDCPKMKNLPDMLLPSLLTLEIYGCPNLKRRCNGRGSRYWPLISHIPCIDIHDRYFSHADSKS